MTFDYDAVWREFEQWMLRDGVHPDPAAQSAADAAAMAALLRSVPGVKP